jgi:tetratricopeptide (TPR) repeat protein
MYLHYEIEPLIYARSVSIARLAPLLGTVQDAPLDFIYKNDVTALVTECLIKAIEARTLEIPGEKPKPPASRERVDQEAYQQRLSVWEHGAEQMRRELAAKDVRQGYIMTRYFYEQLQVFEHDAGSSDGLRRAPRQLAGLDLAEMKLMNGDVDGAAGLVQKSLDSKGNPDAERARAHFLMARIETHEGLMDDAQTSFEQTIALSKDPRTTAWAHIYLGRIYDIQQEREKALAEYREALKSRDGRVDTKAAAEKGLQAPFTVPKRAGQDEDNGPLDPTGKAQKDAYKPEPIVVPVPKN